MENRVAHGKNKKFQVYLAGPIVGYNEVQIHRWREGIKKSFGPSMDFIDPTENLLAYKERKYKFIRSDLDSIEQADGLLVNMWRESIGSALGLVHAHQAGRPVVVANPNHLHNRMLEFYADATEDTPWKAANALLNILRAEANWSVKKSGGRETEPFQRHKLMKSISAACLTVECDGIIIPRLVLPATIERLKKIDRKIKKELAVGDIRKTVMEILNELKNSSQVPGIDKVVNQWQKDKSPKKERRPSAHRQSPFDATKSRCLAKVKVASHGSHSTIWGTAKKQIADIPSPAARSVFEIIQQVPGITEIVLHRFNRQQSGAACEAEIFLSNTQFVIEGKLFDNKHGVKGTCQTFQVWIQFDDQKERILDDIQAGLQKQNLLKSGKDKAG